MRELTQEQIKHVAGAGYGSAVDLVSDPLLKPISYGHDGHKNPHHDHKHGHKHEHQHKHKRHGHRPY